MTEYCKQLIYKKYEAAEFPTVLFGKVINQGVGFITILTGKGRTITINRDLILSLKNTKLPFMKKNERNI